MRKLVLTEDGSIDMSTSLFVSWSIRIIAAVLILQVILQCPSQLYIFFLTKPKIILKQYDLLLTELC